MKVFSNEQEQHIAGYLEMAARLHYSLTKKDTRYLDFQYAEENNVKYPEN